MGHQEIRGKEKKNKYPGHCMNDEKTFIDNLGKGELTDHQVKQLPRCFVLAKDAKKP
jgi:hypothetical protein